MVKLICKQCQESKPLQSGRRVCVDCHKENQRILNRKSYKNKKVAHQGPTETEQVMSSFLSQKW